MLIAACSDWHLNLGDLFPEPYFEREPDLIVLNGDMRNFLPLGIKAWDTPEGSLTLNSLHHALRDYAVIDVFGNHEGCFDWLEWADKDTHFKAAKSFVIPRSREHLPYRFIHGHQITPDWGIVAPIADDFVEFAVKHFPRQWYNFCVKRKWLPSQYGNPDYRLLLLYWFGWAMRGIKGNSNYVIGHSHYPVHLDTPISQMPDVIDLGRRQWTILKI